MKVLYTNHTGQVSGGERSLLTLLEGLPAEVEGVLACPSGELAEAAAAIGVETHHLPGTDGSLKPHPVRTPRTVLQLAHAGRRAREQARDLKVDLIHANSIRAGLSAAIGARSGSPPAVVHVRDCLPPSPLSSASLAITGRRAAALIANSDYTRASLPASESRAFVVHNAVELGAFAPSPGRRSRARSALGIAEDAPVLIVVAQITPWKGQDDAIRIAAGLAERVPGLRLLIVGSAKFSSAATRYDNRGFLEKLEAMTAELDLGAVVQFLGERQDIPDLLAASDMLLAPSWEEPFGRSIVEAMASEVAVAATSVGGPPEILSDGREGLLLPPRDPQGWIGAIAPLIEDRERLRAMGERGRQTALDRFGVERHVAATLDVYRSVLSAAG